MIDTLQRIRLFVAVYEERSFSLAAVREHSTQSGVTQHIQKLEGLFGSALFVRSRSGVVATPAADSYYASCVDILRRHNQARMEMEGFKGGLSGQIALGLTPTLTRAVLAPALKTFVTTNPNVVVKVIDAYSDIIIDKVRSGELDCGIVPGAPRAVGLRSEPFATSPEVLIASATTKLQIQHGQPAELRRLGRLKLVCPSHAQLRRSIVDAYLASVGANIERRLEIDTSLGASDFIAQSDWVSIVPGIVMLSEAQKRIFTICPLVSPPLEVQLFRIERAREPLSTEVMSFLAILKLQVDTMTQQIHTVLASSGPAC